MEKTNLVADAYQARARKASQQLRNLKQEQADELAFRCGRAVHSHAEYLARLAVDETGMGNFSDKVLKKRSKAENTWFEIKDKRTVGIVSLDNIKRLVYYADPLGVVAGVAPCTNPVSTAMFYAMICLKTRNSVLICPHPRATQSTLDTVRLMKAEMSDLGCPEDAIQVVFEPLLHSKEKIKLVGQIMQRADLVVATGGSKLVGAAYQSGTPAYGVGAGNTPVVIHPSAEIDVAIGKVLEGRCFDNGIICASEQHVIVLENQRSEVDAEFKRQGAYLVEDENEQIQFENRLFDPITHHLRSEFIGLSGAKIAKALGIADHEKFNCLVFPLPVGKISSSPLSLEKMAPILSLVSVKDFHEGVGVANRLLDIEGRGHTAAIHIDEKSFEKELLEFAESMPAVHIIVNMPAATSSGGSRYNWLTPSTTLGCGAYGGTMPMESINLSVKQMLNYKAMAMPLEKSRIPENVFV